MSIHIGAKKGEIAETILLPGDPLRAKWIATTFLEEVVCYSEVRGMLGYTGTYNGKKVSVQGTGMGIPSTLIYANELITKYDVKNLIRVGSAGSYQGDVKIRDIVFAMAASTTSNVNTLRFHGASYAPTVSFELFVKAIEEAKKLDIPFKAGNILSTDEFYSDDKESFKKWTEYGVMCVEMETAGLYTLAAKHNVNALSILTISDSLISHENTTSREKEQTFIDMISIALNII